MKKLLLTFFIASLFIISANGQTQTMTKTTDISHAAFWRRPTSLIAIPASKDTTVLFSKKNASGVTISFTLGQLKDSLYYFPLATVKANDKYSIWNKLSALRNATRMQRQAARTRYNTDTSFSAQDLADSNQAITTNKRILQSQLYDKWVANRAFRFLPARSTVFAQCFYNTNPDQVITAFQNNALSFNDSSGYIYTEFFNGFMGPFRFSVGGLFSRSRAAGIDTTGPLNLSSGQLQDSIAKLNKELANIQSLIAGGGNLMFINTIPLIDISDVSKLVKCTLYGGNKLTLNIPGMSTGITQISFMDEISSELFFNWNVSNFSTDPKLQNNLSVYLHAKSAVFLSTEKFFEDAGMPGNKAVGIFTFDGGLTFAQNARVFFKYVVSSSSHINDGITRWSAGVVITPTKI